jgi:hypothetical protein
MSMILQAQVGVATILIDQVTIATRKEALAHAKLVKQWAESLPDKKPRVRKTKAKKSQASPSAARLRKRGADGAAATPSDD